MALRKRAGAGAPDGSPAPVAEAEPQEATRSCAVCGCTFTVTAPAALGGLAGALTCPVCRTPC